MKAKDRLVAKRRLLPVTEVDRNYKFTHTNGDGDLLRLFEGRRQLVVYRFFYAPDVENWPDGACSGCSLFADAVVHPAHLAARDTTLAFVTAAPIDKIESLRERMGWNHIPLYSLPDERFSRDFGVEELFGINVFIRRGERIFRIYFLNGRGIEEVGPVWSFLDMTPLGRQETWQEAPGRPQGDPYTWWHLHDNYGQVAAPNPPLPKDTHEVREPLNALQNVSGGSRDRFRRISKAYAIDKRGGCGLQHHRRAQRGLLRAAKALALADVGRLPTGGFPIALNSDSAAA